MEFNILLWSVIIIFVISRVFYFDPKKRSFLNTYTEILEGDVLSYECQNTGVIIDTKNVLFVSLIKKKTARSLMTTLEKSTTRYPKPVKFTALEI